ncbi:cupin domain-containing protein [Paenarthrobacter sp. NPDC018779]|uniref:cupin domain-containing protein n=1 Tax=Paenarthrobacter sp. NPDC018779 TaxID=3364375 RepID=UPI0037C93DF4
MSDSSHRTPSELSTWTFDWGAIKWHVTPETIKNATSTLGEVIITPGKGHDRHNHPDADEVLYFIEGQGTQTVGDEPAFDVKAGDAVWIPRGTEHSTFNTGWGPLRIIATYTPGGAEKPLRDLPDFKELNPGELPSWTAGQPA